MENTKQEYLYVMDFSDASISEIELTEEYNEIDLFDLLDKYGFNADTCEWMFTTERITEITKAKLK